MELRNPQLTHTYTHPNRIEFHPDDTNNVLSVQVKSGAAKS